MAEKKPLDEDSLYVVSSKNDICRAVDVLAKAFFDYPVIQYLFPNNQKRKLIPLYNLLVKIGVRYGQVIGSSFDLEGVAIWLDSNQDIGLSKEIRCGALSYLYHIGFKSFQKSLSLDTFISKLHKKHMKTHHYYLSQIGVNPHFQGKGFASKLIKHKLDDLPIYLQTNTEKDVSIYQHLGFEIIDKEVIPNTDIPHWSMICYP